MADYVIRVGSHSAQGHRSNNEDRFVVDPKQHLYLVADGMGGQDCGEQASGLAAEIIPREVQSHLAEHHDASSAVHHALKEANRAIVDAGRKQPPGHRRMGTTAVVALRQDDRLYVAGLGDSRAYLIRGSRVDQLTVDHSVAQALVTQGILKPEEAKTSQWSHVLHKFLGCAEVVEGVEVKPFALEGGDRLLMASDGLTNHATEAELSKAMRDYPNPQDCAEYLVKFALDKGSKDNTTCVVVAFDPV